MEKYAVPFYHFFYVDVWKYLMKADFIDQNPQGKRKSGKWFKNHISKRYCQYDYHSPVMGYWQAMFT